MRIGPFDQFDFDSPALKRLGNLNRTRPEEARCLAEACVEIRDRGADAFPAHRAQLYDLYRCGYILSISLTRRGRAATVLDFFDYP